MKADANRVLIFELADTLIRSWWTLVAGVCVGVALGLLAVHVIPKQYEARTRILVAPQQIPEHFVESTVTEDISQRMMILEEARLTEPYRRRLIEQIYGPQETEEEYLVLMAGIRSQVTLVPTLMDEKDQLLAFDLTYRDVDPERAAAVANAVTDLYIEQQTEFRSGRAKDNASTLWNRAEEARLAFEDVDRRLSEFNARHAGETEAQLDANMRLLEARQRDMDSNRSRHTLASSQLATIEEELSKIDTAAATPLTDQIQEARSELKDLLARYSEAHPDVVKQRRKLDDLLSGAQSGAPGEDDGISGGQSRRNDPRFQALHEEAESLRLEIAGLKQDESGLRREIARYESRIQAVPQVQPQLTALLADHEMLRETYLELKQEADRAKESQFVEESLRGERFEVAVRAGVPGSPAVPKPVPIIGLAVFATCLLFIGPPMVRRALNPLISSEAGLRSLAGIPVLVSLPRVMTPANRSAGTKRFAKNLGLSLASVAVLAVVVVFITWSNGGFDTIQGEAVSGGEPAEQVQVNP